MNDDRKEIDGFPDCYILRSGHVESRGKILKPWKSGRGYLKVALQHKSIRKGRYVHHLVMAYFGPPKPNERAMALHRDDNKSNNCMENLRWGTHGENMKDAVRNGITMNRKPKSPKLPKVSREHPLKRQRGSARPASRLSENDIGTIAGLSGDGLSQREIARRFGVTQPVISDILNGKSWTHVPR